jgi:hypothetical protein
MSYRDKELGMIAPPPPLEIVDLVANQLIRIEYENRNRLLPKIFLDDETFIDPCYPWSDSQ